MSYTVFQKLLYKDTLYAYMYQYRYDLLMACVDLKISTRTDRASTVCKYYYINTTLWRHHLTVSVLMKISDRCDAMPFLNFSAYVCWRHGIKAQNFQDPRHNGNIRLWTETTEITELSLPFWALGHRVIDSIIKTATAGLQLSWRESEGKDHRGWNCGRDKSFSQSWQLKFE